MNTIADYDRVIVVDKGEIAEQGEPLELLKGAGLFTQLVKNTGKNETLKIIDTASYIRRTKSRHY